MQAEEEEEEKEEKQSRKARQEKKTKNTKKTTNVLMCRTFGNSVLGGVFETTHDTNKHIVGRLSISEVHRCSFGSQQTLIQWAGLDHSL